MTNKEAIQVLQRTAWLGGETYGLQNRAEQVAEAIRMAITALQAQDKLQDIEYMCRLSGGADYFRVFADLLEEENNSNDQLNNSTVTKDNSIKDCISRQAAIDKAKELFDMGECYCDKYSIVGMINSLPSVQPEIIRCKDCKFYTPLNRETKSGICSLLIHQNFGDDWYCAGAERRTDDGE